MGTWGNSFGYSEQEEIEWLKTVKNPVPIMNLKSVEEEHFGRPEIP